MTRTITALFDARADAEAAENRLKASTIDAGHIRIHDKTSPDFHATGRSTAEEPGIWASIKHALLPAEDRHLYEEGLRRGGFLLTADVDDEQVGAAVRVLEEADTVDIDDRATQWRASGWDYTADDTSETGSALFGTNEVAPIIDESAVSTPDRLTAARELDRGGSRYRTYTSDRT